MKPLNVLLLLLLVGTAFTSDAQDKSPVKFGKISQEDFTIKEAFDTGASAVVIADIGRSYFEGNTKGSFSLIFKYQRRVKILNKNGFDAANVKVPLYTDGNNEEKLVDLKAHTYNLENGKVVDTKLDNSAVFKDKLDKNYTLKKFTLPSVKEGSIIEYSYTITSDFISNLQPWTFQDEYPCLWSEYEVEIPQFYQYVTLTQGYQQSEQKTSSYTASFKVNFSNGAEKSETEVFNSMVNSTRWVMKNIEAMKEENYSTTTSNYVSKLEFQLAGIQYPNDSYHDQIGSWKLLGEKLMKSEYFGDALSRNNNWLDDELKKNMAGIDAKIEKARKLFAYTRDNFTCTDHSALYIETSLKEAFKKRSGSVADINLLLIAMLRHEGIEANPVILSTRSHGFTSEIYPLLQRFNYVICKAEIEGKVYNLDASQPYNGFGKLPAYCYNGHARIISQSEALPVYFEPDSLKEQKVTTVFISNDEKAGLTGTVQSRLGYYESYNVREKISKSSEKDFFKGIKSAYNFDMEISETGIDSLKKPELPATVHYDFSFKPADDAGMLYLNPMLTEAYKENPFKSADRKYPVSMPYSTDETYVFSMQIPEGYTVEEIPKSVKVAFNENEGYFEYLIQKSDAGIQLRSRIKMNKANFQPEDYSTLRDFYTFIVKKQGEQIVLKKKG